MKKKNPVEKNLPDIGKIVKNLLKEQRKNMAWFCKQTEWAKGTVSDMLKRKNWNIADLLYAGQILKKDLLQNYYPQAATATIAVSEFESLMKEKQKLESELSQANEELKIVTVKYETSQESIKNMRR